MIVFSLRENRWGNYKSSGASDMFRKGVNALRWFNMSRAIQHSIANAWKKNQLQISIVHFFIDYLLIYLVILLHKNISFAHEHMNAFENIQTRRTKVAAFCITFLQKIKCFSSAELQFMNLFTYCTIAFFHQT